MKKVIYLQVLSMYEFHKYHRCIAAVSPSKYTAANFFIISQN